MISTASPSFFPSAQVIQSVRNVVYTVYSIANKRSFSLLASVTIGSLYSDGLL